jgi:cytochrome c-type biogenesis protein CcmH/NrfG
MRTDDIHKGKLETIQGDGFVCLLLVLAILVVYGQLRSHNFISFDDGMYVTENETVRTGLSLDGIKWAFGFTDIAYWHPLTWLSHMLDCQLFGLDPGSHHLVNLIFHIANSLLLFIAFKRMTGDRWRSAFIAALFALHPINVESVAWVAERKNVLSTFFWMLALLSYSFYAERPALKRFVLVILLVALGLMSKPALVTLPFVFLLLDLWPLNRIHSRASTTDKSFRGGIFNPVFIKESNLGYLVLEKIPFFFLSGISVYLSWLTAQHHGIVISPAEVPIQLRFANALIAYMTYIGKLIYPLKLAIFYPYPKTIPVWLTLGAVIWLVCISATAVRFSMRFPFLLVGWLWYLGTLIPQLGFVQAGIWPALADRWAYVPLIGIFVMIAWGVPEPGAKRWFSRTGVAAIAGILLTILSLMTWSQAGYWRNNITLYQHAVEVTKGNDVAHNNMGAAFFYAGKLDKAIYHFVEALKILPGLAAAHDNLNSALATHVSIDGAIAKMHKLILLYPQVPALNYNLGNLYRNKGELDKAIVQYQNALFLKPDFIQAMNNLGGVYILKKEYSKAISQLKKIAEVQPHDAGICFDIACVYAKQEMADKSIVWLKKAIKNGFCNWKRLENDNNLKTISQTAEYRKFIKNLIPH